MDLTSPLSDIDDYIFGSDQVYVYMMTIVAVLVLAGSPFVLAWLAGWKYKLQSIITIGMVILSIGVFLDNVISLLSLATANSGSSVWMRVFGSLSKLLLAVGTGSVITNVLQLAIEQIPEDSASQLSSLMSLVCIFRFFRLVA